jgi:hypothetical protein
MRAIGMVRPSDAANKANVMPSGVELPLDQSLCIAQICIARTETASFLRMGSASGAACRVIDL